MVVRIGDQIIYQDLQSAAADPSVSTRECQDFSHSSLTIAIQDVTVGNLLNRKTILKDIQVEFKPKEMILILGGSGAGKSTFMEAVTGLVYSNTSAYFDGVDLLSDGKKQG
ncbi:MAG: ATP-binding protein [Streptococcus sp.]